MLPQPDIRPICDKVYRLVRSYKYEWVHVSEHVTVQHRLRVPSGFTYDGASVPRCLWSLSGLSPDGLIRASALVHDFIYVNKGIIPYGAQYQLVDDEWMPVEGKWTRKTADRLFKRMMLEAAIDPTQIWWAYFAVRKFGWLLWRKRR